MSHKLGVFISGTDTGVGKTVVSSLLLASLRTFGIRVGYFKPVQTGTELDTETVSKLAGIPLSKLPSPTYQFPEPVAPSRAAVAQGAQIQIDHIIQQWKLLDDRAWVLEGAGGLLVPLNSRQTMRDLIAALGLKLVIVSSTRLGTINHTLLTIEAAKSAGISVAGVVLVGQEDVGLEAVLTEMSQVPVIAKIPQFASLTSTLIQDSAIQYFPAALLRNLYD